MSTMSSTKGKKSFTTVKIPNLFDGRTSMHMGISVLGTLKSDEPPAVQVDTFHEGSAQEDAGEGNGALRREAHQPIVP